MSANSGYTNVRNSEESFDLFPLIDNGVEHSFLASSDRRPCTSRVSLSTWLTSASLSNEQKQAFLIQLSHEELNSLYEHQIAVYGLHPPSKQRTLSDRPQDLSEETYKPTCDCVEPPPDPNAPLPIYAPYAGLFATSEAAKRHRKRIRVAPKSQAPDVDRVKRYGRKLAV
jgi:hypothetical protein